ncbi:MAG TPA: phosphodiester glycosidase family protein, partial [Fervidobacterium nodosum]|nr:phosphodiester glycosidase family protein [Fervidobacterium nodosum]
MLANGTKKLRYLNILSAIILLYSSVIFSQVLLFNNKVYTLTNGYITEDQLKDIGFNIVKAERMYLIYNKKLIIGSSGDFIIDFEQYVPNAYTTSNGKLLVKIDSLINVLKLQTSNNIFFDKPVSINSISYTNDVIKIDTSAQLNKELLNISLLDNKFTIKLTPFDLPKNIPQGLNISKSNGTLIISIPKDVEKYELSITNQTIQIFLIPTSKKIDYIKRTEKFAGRTFTVNYLILDPRFVDLVPV